MSKITRLASRWRCWSSSVLVFLAWLFGQPNRLYPWWKHEPIRDGRYGAGQLLVGLPIAYLWLVLEVGLVEEFFFRALIQSRLAAYYKSEMTGMVLSCVVFGLAHAPGLILRGTGSITPVGETPSALMGIGYSIVTLSVTGFCFGIIWIRTRNLLLLMLIHAAVDLLPSYTELMTAFGRSGS